MTISVNLQYVRRAEESVFDTFSTVQVKDDEGNDVVLFFNHKNHADHAYRVAREINRIAEDK